MAGTSSQWTELAKRYLKVELKRAGVGHAELARRLTEMGLPETEGSITVKINRGSYPAWFLFAVLRALNLHVLRLDD